MQISTDNLSLIEVIVKKNGNISMIENDLAADIEVLNDNYAIITLPAEKAEFLFSYPEIVYVELPKILTLSINEGAARSCVPQVQDDFEYALKGAGAVISIIDSGIDYTHPDFRNDDGTSRILWLWDQTGSGTPPEGFKSGAEYTQQQLNAALMSPDPFAAVPAGDEFGHGTCVAGVAAGNGRQSGGREKGVAPEASLIIVKLGNRGEPSFARTTEIMRAIKYSIEKAYAMSMPISINISYGTNNGSHDGSSLFETFIDDISQEWKCVVVVATGNEASEGHHFSAKIKQNELLNVSFTTAANLSQLTINIWKNFADTFLVEFVTPTGMSSGVIPFNRLLTRMNVEGISVSVFYGQPTHYNGDQEIYILLQADKNAITQGLWSIKITGSYVIDGRVNIWLPTTEEVSEETSFAIPSIDTTLTIPSTSASVISVGGYDSRLGSYASFSGRGYTRGGADIKPDISAPAVNVFSTRSGGGYDTFTGTSLAAPFVTGSAALMMEWGIVRGNDPFLFGQRIKAFLQKGARRDPSLSYPNPIWGYGALCLYSTMDFLTKYIEGGR